MAPCSDYRGTTGWDRAQVKAVVEFAVRSLDTPVASR